MLIDLRAPATSGHTHGLRAIRVFLPTLLLTLLTSLVLAVGLTHLLRTGRVGVALLNDENELAGPVVIAFVLLAVVIERCAPAVRRPLLARGQIQDGCFFVFFIVFVVPFVAVLGSGFSVLIDSYIPWLLLRSTGPVPRVFLVALALVLMDGCNWATHLAHHRLAPLWRIHAVHHSQEELSVLTTFRAHPLVHTTTTFFATLPVVALTGLHPFTPLCITGYLLLGAIPHLNVDWTYGPLEWLFVSPAFHRVHHRMELPQDVNLGIALSIWDHLFGRAVRPARGQPAVTGLLGRPIEIEQAVAAYRPVQLLAQQLIEPFRRQANGERAAQSDAVAMIAPLGPVTLAETILPSTLGSGAPQVP